jgi:hypothetical protein
VKEVDLRQCLSDFSAERLALYDRHVAGATVVGHYDFNNTYQYVIAREDTHLSWLAAALADCGAESPPAASALPVPAVGRMKGSAAAAADRNVLSDDAVQLDGFVERWRPVVEALSHARHRTMLQVVLGESREHQRLFEQAAAGDEDVLGRRTGGVERQGSVLSTRWVE